MICGTNLDEPIFFPLRGTCGVVTATSYFMIRYPVKEPNNPIQIPVGNPNNNVLICPNNTNAPIIVPTISKIFGGVRFTTILFPL